MLAYSCGSYDILRENDLQNLDRQIQLSNLDGIKHFGVGIYTNGLCENLGIDMPLKSLEDRMKILSQIRGVDFTFPVISLDENLLEKQASHFFSKHLKSLEKSKEKQQKPKKYNLAYVPGTYDLFHAGHLENLMIAASKSNKLIVGVKSDELVESHKDKTPIISAEERIAILRHFKFVDDVYLSHTRDFNNANNWIQSKYEISIDVIYVGSDLKEDFNSITNFNIIFTDRDPELMKSRSSTAYSKKYLTLSAPSSSKYTGSINSKNQKSTALDNNFEIDK